MWTGYRNLLFVFLFLVPAFASAQTQIGGGGGGTPPSVSCATANGIIEWLTASTQQCSADFTIDATAHTLLAGAAGLVDLSAQTSSTSFKIPVIAGCSAGAAGALCFDSTGGNVRTNIAGVTSGFIVGAQSVVAANSVLKSGNGVTLIAAASSIADDAKDITSAEIASLGNRVALTSDFTFNTNTALALITNGAGNELKWTLPTSKALNVSFHCGLLYSQATAAAADAFGIGITGTAPTQANAFGITYTSTTVLVAGNLTALASTTPTNVVAFTPSASATIFEANLDGTVEQPSNATPGVLGIYVLTGNTADAITVKRGSYCSLF